MIDFSEIILKEMAVHHIGVGIESVEGNPDPVDLSQIDDINRISGIFSSGFNPEALYRLKNEGSGEQTTVMSLIREYYEKVCNFQSLGVKLVHRYFQSIEQGPVREGEFIVCRFEGIKIDGISCEGIGIYKTDGKDEFLHFHEKNDRILISISEGIQIRKSDNSCIILAGVDQDEQTVLLRKINLSYSKNIFADDFLNVVPVQTSYYNTSNQINLLKTYLDKEAGNEDRLNRLDTMNRSLEYLQNHDQFQQDEFESSVFEDPEEINAFQSFRKDFSRDRNLEITDEFEISQNALKQKARYIRSVIKLDKNFHIYVHGNRHNIERGFDQDRGLNYYKIYFQEED